VVVLAVGLYLPTVRYGYVLDDRAIVAHNPATQSVPAALRAVARPYWPPPAEGGLWRPLTILTFAVDRTVAGDTAAGHHAANALWHGIASLLVFALLAPWVGRRAAVVGALVFAVHPVHVEAVAGLVGRGELVAAVGTLGAAVAARAGRPWLVLGAGAAAMLAKEHGAAVPLLLLALYWLDDGVSLRLRQRWVWAALAAITIAYLVAWRAIGGAAAADVAPSFLGGSVVGRLQVALPAITQGARLLVWPAALSADYNPQVIPAYQTFTPAAALGALVVVALGMLVWACRGRAPAVAFAAVVAALAYLPTSNLLFPSGVVLAERNLYLPVLLVAAGAAQLFALAERRGMRHPAFAVALLAIGAATLRSAVRLPAWRDNRSYLVTLLEDHPESYRGHASAASVFQGLGDTGAARRSYERATALYDRDPHLLAARALFLWGVGDRTSAVALARRARALLPRQRVALRVAYLEARSGGDAARARAVADTAVAWFPFEAEWYAAVPP
jgi:hypothetical protein